MKLIECPVAIRQFEKPLRHLSFKMISFKEVVYMLKGVKKVPLIETIILSEGQPLYKTKIDEKLDLRPAQESLNSIIRSFVKDIYCFD